MNGPVVPNGIRTRVVSLKRVAFGARLSHTLGGTAGTGAATGTLTWGATGAGAVARETTYQTIYRHCMT
jgi:hypothetical protein